MIGKYLTREELISVLVRHVNSGRPLILSLSGPAQIGEVVSGLETGNIGDADIDHPFTVKREATFDEWWDSLEPDVRPSGPREQHRIMSGFGPNYFYEVSTD